MNNGFIFQEGRLTKEEEDELKKRWNARHGKYRIITSSDNILSRALLQDIEKPDWTKPFYENG
jgi:mRNA-degrading endonuclease RelE of RelBE toxin-antitoxin system